MKMHLHRIRKSYDATERSLAAEMMLRLKRGEDVRVDKIAALRQSLSHDKYENDLKLDIAITRLVEALEGDFDS